MNILQLNASVRGAASVSTRLVRTVVARLLTLYPDAALKVRDLGDQAILDEFALQALMTPPESRGPAQFARVAVDDQTIAELMAADVIVIGMPMYNFGVPAQFKAWIDAVSRAQVTFRYTAYGPEGLVKGKKVIVALARGGLYPEGKGDSQVPYLKIALGFLGMTDMRFIHAEGLAMGDEFANKALAEADAEIAALSL